MICSRHSPDSSNLTAIDHGFCWRDELPDGVCLFPLDNSLHPDVRCRGSSIALDSLTLYDLNDQCDILDKLSGAHETVIGKKQDNLSLHEKLEAVELAAAISQQSLLGNSWLPADRGVHGGDLYLKACSLPVAMSARKSCLNLNCAGVQLMEAEDQVASLSSRPVHLTGKSFSSYCSGSTPGGPLEHRLSNASGQSGGSVQSSWGSARGLLSGSQYLSGDYLMDCGGSSRDCFENM